MKPDAPIPPLTDGSADNLSVLIARLKADIRFYQVENKMWIELTIADLTTVLHHLEAYREAVERWAHTRQSRDFTGEEHTDSCENLSAVHARAKGGK